MGYRIYKSIVLFVAADFANKKGCIEDQTDDYDEEEYNSKNKESYFAPVEQNPANIQRNCQRHQASAQRDEESYRLTATTDCHAVIV